MSRWLVEGAPVGRRAFWDVFSLYHGWQSVAPRRCKQVGYTELKEFEKLLLQVCVPLLILVPIGLYGAVFLVQALAGNEAPVQILYGSAFEAFRTWQFDLIDFHLELASFDELLEYVRVMAMPEASPPLLMTGSRAFATTNLVISALKPALSLLTEYAPMLLDFYKTLKGVGVSSRGETIDFWEVCVPRGSSPLLRLITPRLTVDGACVLVDAGGGAAVQGTGGEAQVGEDGEGGEGGQAP